MADAHQELRPDPVMLVYLRAPARPGLRALALDDLPIIDRPGIVTPNSRSWPLALVASQSDDLAGGSLDEAVGDVVCERCGSVLAQRIVWAGRPAVIGLVRGRRWSLSRSWGRRQVSAVLAARQRGQWFCLLDHPDTPAHLPLACRAHGSMSVAATEAQAAPAGAALPIAPPGYT
jgi:hypothetical protein